MWRSNDWEHRFSRTPLPGWEQDGHWIALYPTDVCTGSYAPLDGCTYQNGGQAVALWGGFQLDARSPGASASSAPRT